MPTYAAILYTRDADWTSPEEADTMAGYGAFSVSAGPAMTGGAALLPTCCCCAPAGGTRRWPPGRRR